MIKESTIITESIMKSGIGRYALNLYKLGIFEELCHLSYSGKSDFDNHVFFTKRWGINTLVSYYLGGPYKRYVKKYRYVHASSPSHFHLVKYNWNMVGTIHDFFPLKYPQTRAAKWWFNKNLKFVPKLQSVITISDHIKNEAQERFRDVEFTTIHLWIDDDNFRPRDKNEIRDKLGLDREKIYLLNVSRDVPRKNIDLLPKIVNRLDERFVLIGIGDFERIMPQFKDKKLIALKNIPDSLYPLYFNASDLLIHTAIDGGFEYPFIEAVASNLNIVAFDMPISREVLRNKGILVPFIDKDSPDEWVDAILKNYDRKVDYGEIVEYYKPGRARREYLDFYRKIGWMDGAARI